MPLSDYIRYGKSAERLGAAIRCGRVSHAYLIEGDRNTDKNGFAEAFASALLCREAPGEGCGSCSTCRKIRDGNYEDLYVVEPQDTTSGKTGSLSIKDADCEELQARLKLRPSAGERNIAVIREAGTMTERAQTRLLKTLEEPPAGTVIMLLTENEEELLPTIRSRTARIRLQELEKVSETPLSEAAERIISMIRRKAFFFDIKKELDTIVKDRRDALALLEAVTACLERELRTGTGEQAEKAARAILLTEKAKRTASGSASYQYAVRDLILKLKGVY